VNTYGGSRQLDSLTDYVQHTTHKLLDERDTDDTDEVITCSLCGHVDHTTHKLLDEQDIDDTDEVITCWCWLVMGSSFAMSVYTLMMSVECCDIWPKS